MIYDFCIFKCKNSVLQSGYALKNRWCVQSNHFVDLEPQVYNVSGLLYSTDVDSQLRLYFMSEKAAVSFVRSIGKTYEFLDDKDNNYMKPKSYANNFININDRFDKS